MTPEYVAIAALIGLMVGSFLNVCIARLPAGESIIAPSSRCPRCLTPIQWYDNVPVLSYVLLLRGRCRACHQQISWRYPLVELITAASFAATAWVFDDPWLLVARLVFTALLIVLFGTDLDVQRLPNVITYPGIAMGLAFSAFAPPGLRDALLGAALGAAILWIVRWTWLRMTGVDGMGLGDVKMLAMIGAFLGWRQVWVTLFLASVTGALVGIALTLFKARSLQTKLPFGTFLAVAAYVASLEHGLLLAWYLSLYK